MENVVLRKVIFEALTLTVLLSPLLHCQRANFDLFRGRQGSSGGHEADGRGAQEAVGTPQRGGAQPAGPR